MPKIVQFFGVGGGGFRSLPFKLIPYKIYNEAQFTIYCVTVIKWLYTFSFLHSSKRTVANRERVRRTGIQIWVRIRCDHTQDLRVLVSCSALQKTVSLMLLEYFAKFFFDEVFPFSFVFTGRSRDRLYRPSRWGVAARQLIVNQHHNAWEYIIII